MVHSINKLEISDTVELRRLITPNYVDSQAFNNLFNTVTLAAIGKAEAA